jgi:hypothetical protein
MQENSQKRLKVPQWLRMLLAYGLTIGSIFVLPLLFALSESLYIGIWLLIIAIPLIPAAQSLILRKKPPDLFIFLKRYVAEFASLFLQLSLLLVSAPVIAILIAGRLAGALLFASGIAWFIVGLQQIGFDIGSKMLKDDMMILLWVTIGLTAVLIIFYFFQRFIKTHEDSYFSFWAKQFAAIRDFFYLK